MRTASDWFKEASKRPPTVSKVELSKRRKVSEIFKKSSIESGMIVTDDMLRDSELLLLGRMDRPEFNKYISLKKREEACQKKN